MLRKLFWLSWACLLIILAAQAYAQDYPPSVPQDQIPCGKTADMFKFLHDEMGYVRGFQGLNPNSTLLTTIWVNFGDNTWIVSLSKNNGETCAIVEGIEATFLKTTKGRDS